MCLSKHVSLFFPFEEKKIWRNNSSRSFCFSFHHDLNENNWQSNGSKSMTNKFTWSKWKPTYWHIDLLFMSFSIRFIDWRRSSKEYQSQWINNDQIIRTIRQRHPFYQIDIEKELKIRWTKVVLLKILSQRSRHWQSNRTTDNNKKIDSKKTFPLLVLRCVSVEFLLLSAEEEKKTHRPKRFTDDKNSSFFFLLDFTSINNDKKTRQISSMH